MSAPATTAQMSNRKWRSLLAQNWLRILARQHCPAFAFQDHLDQRRQETWRASGLEKGSDTVVRSTLLDIPATLPDRFSSPTPLFRL
jgi:hypothetical protein